MTTSKSESGECYIVLLGYFLGASVREHSTLNPSPPHPLKDIMLLACYRTWGPLFSRIIVWVSFPYNANNTKVLIILIILTNNNAKNANNTN